MNKSLTQVTQNASNNKEVINLKFVVQIRL